MFQFPGSAHLAVYHAFSMVGCPIRTPADQLLFADPRSFSQLTTSFFASESLGIPHTPFLTSLFDSPMCSLLVTLACQLFTTYSLLFLQYVNELFAPHYSEILWGMAIPFDSPGAGNAIISPQTSVDSSTDDHVHYLNKL